MKMPYSLVALRVEELIKNAALFSLVQNYEAAYAFFDEMALYLTYCGWSEEEFDCETLKRIDRGWELCVN